MSDVSQGPGWWLASDGKWYPPQSASVAAPPPPQGGYGTQVQAARKKPLRRRPLFWVLMVVLVFMGGCIAIVAGVSTSIDHKAHQQHTVVYSITGSGTSTASDITYATVQQGSGQNGEAQATNAPVPWSKTITASGLFTAFSLSAQNGGSGSITCTISEDGRVLNTNTATGQFAVASCDATGS
jgi:hypothetical protein